MMTSTQIRQSVLDFFRSKQHTIVPSSSLMPDSPNLLFTNAGMREDDGTTVCCFDWKKSRNDWRICVLVMWLNSKVISWSVFSESVISNQ